MWSRNQVPANGMSMEVLPEAVCRERSHAFFPPSLSPTWNVNVMAGALETSLDPKDVVKPKKC